MRVRLPNALMKYLPIIMFQHLCLHSFVLHKKIGNQPIVLRITAVSKITKYSELLLYERYILCAKTAHIHTLLFAKTSHIRPVSAGFRGIPRGPGPPSKGAPHHVHMFSYMCDMCAPLNPFYRGKFLCRRY